MACSEKVILFIASVNVMVSIFIHVIVNSLFIILFHTLNYDLTIIRHVMTFSFMVNTFNSIT